MNQVIPADAGSAVSTAARTAVMILVGSLVTAMTIGWLGFLFWLVGVGVIAFAHWI